MDILESKLLELTNAVSSLQQAISRIEQMLLVLTNQHHDMDSGGEEDDFVEPPPYVNAYDTPFPPTAPAPEPQDAGMHDAWMRDHMRRMQERLQNM